MLNIHASFEKFPNDARRMRECGQELNSQLKTAYTNVENMHSVWRGEKYQLLVQDFNNIIPQINQLLELVVGTIPFLLEDTANGYARANELPNVTTAEQTAPNMIVEISSGKDEGMDYQEAEVLSIKETVSSNIENAKEKMNEIYNICQQIDWESMAGTNYKDKVREAKNKIITSFENIKSDFEKYMNQSKEIFENNEKR